MSRQCNALLRVKISDLLKPKALLEAPETPPQRVVLPLQVSHASQRLVAGDRGSFFLFDLQQKPGSLASTLEIRGLLEARPEVAAKQELVVVMVSDSILNIGYQAPSETPVLTEIQPVIGA